MTIEIPATTTNFAVNLATEFPAIVNMVSLSMVDNSLPGEQVNFSTVNTGTKFQLRAGAAVLMGLQGTPPTLYFDNSGVNICYLEICVLGN